nr:substrate-binding domain-containing protein [Propionicimonas sp.]
MQRRVVAATALAVMLAGCVGQVGSPTPGPSIPPSPSGSSAPSAAPLLALTDLPRIDGSTANIPLISLLIQRMTGVPESMADNTVKTTGTPTAWRNLVDGSADVLVVYEADRTVAAEVRESGIELEVHPIGRDALVFFANESNPVTSLSTAQYKAIYTGRLVNWAQVGGRRSTIVAYQRPEESGSQALLRKYVVGGARMAKAPSDRVTGEMAEIITGVASYANTGNALGYSVYYYLAKMYAVKGIKMLGVSGVMPSTETIADGTYPYANDFYAVVRADEPAGSPARRVLDWLLSDDGRQAVLDAGYVPVQR